MKAVMYGAGNIGRGFIGALFSQSGYSVSFIDVDKSIVERLKKEETYPIRYVSNTQKEDVWIDNVTAIDGSELEKVSDAISECDIMATAVGVRVLDYIIPNIITGLRKRWQNERPPLNIILCENLKDVNKLVEKKMKDMLSEDEQRKFDQSVGLVEASIGRMVPVQTDAMKDGEPVRVCTERYGYLPVDQAAFKGNIPKIKNMIPYSPFEFYIERKLYVHNMGHAICAYLGCLENLNTICESIDRPDIRVIVQNAMLESAAALSLKFNVSLHELYPHIMDLLSRFSNAELGDTCQRVGRDPARKLAKQDRLIGAASVACEQGIAPIYICVGIAAAVHYYIHENRWVQGSEEAIRVLTEVSNLTKDSELMDTVMSFYHLILENGSLCDLRRFADELKSKTFQNVI